MNTDDITALKIELKGIVIELKGIEIEIKKLKDNQHKLIESFKKIEKFTNKAHLCFIYSSSDDSDDSCDHLNNSHID
jgi:hypothetical protein